MSLLRITSPHTHTQHSTQRVMLTVIAATLPGLITLTYFFGWGTLINVIMAALFAVASEAFILKLRNKPMPFYLLDCSAVVTGLLLGLSIPPTSPWWLILIGSTFAIIIVKQLYGGLGSNPFNPAMAAYVLLLISFPVEMTSWLPSTTELSFIQSIQITFLGTIGELPLDGFTMATPLDSLKSATRELGLLPNYELYKVAEQSPVFGFRPVLGLYSLGWCQVNLAFLAGGLFLLYKRVIHWHIPLAMLISLVAVSTLFFIFDRSNGSPLFHILSGGTMLGAFFIATDPVSAATSPRGRLLFGALIGLLIYIIRTWGGYPDAIAFSVLLLNLAAPTIDYYTQPRTYGHSKAKRGIAKADD